jgi:hypothetical protein
MLHHCTSYVLHPASSTLTTAYPPRCDLVLSLCDTFVQNVCQQVTGCWTVPCRVELPHYARATRAPRSFLAPMPAVGVDLFLSVLYHTALHTPAFIPTGQPSIGASVPMAHAMPVIACITSLQPHFKQKLSLIQTLHLQLCAYLSCFIPTAQRG